MTSKDRESARATATLVIRLSSLGDVAMLVPVLYPLAGKYPGEHFVVVTKEPFLPLFINKPPNVELFPVHARGRHAGARGAWRLPRDIARVANAHGKSSRVNVADLHGVTRSWLIDLYFRTRGATVAMIDKGRKEKKALARARGKRLVPLQPSRERYRAVFARLGYDVPGGFVSLFPCRDRREGTSIGIAPFARHAGKIYPLDKMEEVIRLLHQDPAVNLFLFGGKSERQLLEEWARKHDRVESVAGRLSFPGELRLMNSLDVMLTIASGNMHLASLVNTPVVSIWGATHPHAGFLGYNQSPRDVVQLDLPCRPCSIFGDKPCRGRDLACMTGISPARVAGAIQDTLTRAR